MERPDVLDMNPAAGLPSVGAVDRAIDILMLFGRSLQPSLGVTEIAQELGMPKSGVHRVLSTLRRRRLVTYDAGTRKYALGQAAIALSQSYVTRIDVQAMASESLAELMQRTDETATLAVRRHGSVVYRAQSVPERELRYEVRLTRPVPVHVGASGKAFLANLPNDETDDFLRHAVLESVTARTVTDVGVLRRELAAIRSAGFATSHGERVEGVGSVAAPVFDFDGYPIAVLAVSGPTARFDPSAPAVVRAVVEATARLSAEMGHQRG